MLPSVVKILLQHQQALGATVISLGKQGVSFLGRTCMRIKSKLGCKSSDVCPQTRIIEAVW